MKPVLVFLYIEFICGSFCMGLDSDLTTFFSHACRTHLVSALAAFDKLLSTSAFHFIPRPYIKWHMMRQLNPSKGGGIGFRSGGEILLHYTLKPIPPEGLYRYAGEDPPKMTLPGSYPKVVRSLGDFFGSHAVEVQVLLLGLRGMEPYMRLPIANPCVEIELSGKALSLRSDRLL